jgi:F-type H+-transporting ATPase subunit a
MNTKRLIILAGLGLAVLWIVGCGTGVIVSSIQGTEGLLPSPGVHLPAQQVLGDQRGEPLAGGFKFVLTNTILSSLIASIAIILLFVLVTRRISLVPGRLQSLVEAIVEGLLGFMESIVGQARARQLFPLIATIFLFVLFNAWIALIPIYQSLGIYRYEEVTLQEVQDHFTSPNEVTVKDLKAVLAARLEPALLQDLLHEGASQADAKREAHAEALKHAKEAKIMVTGEGQITKPLTIKANKFSDDAVAKIERAGGVAKKIDGGLSATLLRPAGTDMNMPLALALISFVLVEALGLASFRLHYLNQFFPVRRILRGDMMGLFVGFLELISHFVRLVSFTFRLFGNLTAGEILLLLSAFLSSFVFTVVFYGLELLVGFIQALIFAGLTLVFASVALTPHEEESQAEHH